MIDLEKAKSRLIELQNSRRDWSRLSYSLKEGNNTLRFVLLPGESWPFKYGRMYYNLQRQFFCSPEDEDDPILEKLNELSKSGNEDSVEFARKYFPSRRVFALAVVREQEDKGAVWVDFPQKIEKEIMNYLFNAEYIEMQVDKIKAIEPGYNAEVLDITHPIYGVDFIVNKKKGSGFPEYTVTPRKLTNPFSKLAETDKAVTEIMNDIPDFKEAYKHYSKEEMLEIWEKFLLGDDSSESDTKEEIPVEEEKVDISAALAKFKENRNK